jgi:uncharacterized membrane protein YdjX (TVP38/TMEM64 family)
LRLLVLAVVIGVSVAGYAGRAQLQPAAIQALLVDNAWAPVAFVLAHIVVSLVFIPRTIMAVAAGLVFGLWAGIALTTIGAMAGSIAGFALVRYLHRGIFALDGERGLAWLALLKKRLDDGGWRGVALIRLVPILPHTPVNYAFGLTRVSMVDYLWGTLLGLLPMTVFWVDVGAAGTQVSWIEPTLVGLASLVASLLLPRALRWLRRQR